MDRNFDRRSAQRGQQDAPHSWDGAAAGEADEPPDPPLPRGRHKLSRDEVTGNQRRRLLVAAGAALAEKGYWQLRVSDIAAGAGVSRATFYAQFRDKLDCLLCAHQAASDELAAEISAACGTAPGWPGNAVAGVDAVMRFVSDNPGYASLLTMSAVGAHPALGEQVLQGREEWAERLRRARDGVAGLDGVPPATDEIAVGASVSFIAQVILRRGPEGLVDQMPDLAQAILALYAGGGDRAIPHPRGGENQ